MTNSQTTHVKPNRVNINIYSELQSTINSGLRLAAQGIFSF
ncbi:hypothetical protein [Nostoc sp.]